MYFWYVKKIFRQLLIKCLKFLNSLVLQTCRMSALVVEIPHSLHNMLNLKRRASPFAYYTSELLLFSINVFHWTLMSDKILIGRPVCGQNSYCFKIPLPPTNNHCFGFWSDLHFFLSFVWKYIAIVDKGFPLIHPYPSHCAANKLTGSSWP